MPKRSAACFIGPRGIETKPMRPFLGFVLLILLSDACAFADAKAPPADPAKEFRYPAIHLEVTEAKLSPALQKDKQELLRASQILEDLLHQSGAVHRDPALEEAIQGLIPLDQLGEKAAGFYYRIYLVKDPDVNAMTAPSGSIYVNSGLLAMLDNFEQLRAVLAHEVHHVIDQDIVYEFKRIKAETGFLKVLSLVAAPAVAYAISESDSDTARTIANVYTGASWAVGIAYQLSLYGYSRGHENECDEFALNLFDKHGYEVLEIKRLFGHFEDQQKKYDRNVFHTHLFSTHETPKQRMARVEKFAKKQAQPAEGAPKEDRRYHELTRDIRILNARLNVRLGRLQHALDDLERLKASFPRDARVMNAFGEAYSKLAEDRKVLQRELNGREWSKVRKEKEEAQKARWIEQAKASFEQARALDPQFPDPWRGEAQLLEAQKDNRGALELYQKYAALAPEAKDKRYIQAKIDRLNKLIAKEKQADSKKKGDK